LHHVVLEQWSRRSSPLHRRDPRAKIFVLLVFLVAVATAHRALPQLSAVLLVLLLAAFVWARIPLVAALRRAALVLPFTAVFVVVCWLAGDPGRGLALALKSYLSALAVLLVMATTPVAALLAGLETWRVPRFLLMVSQFLYRYLFVVSEEAQHMRKAAACRAGSRRALSAGLRFRAAAGALAVLFARSHGHAEEIHRAMLGRGFRGHFRPLAARPFTGADALFLTAACSVVLLLRLGLEGVR
jgi:cobalt/nickel transport system permease protein